MPDADPPVLSLIATVFDDGGPATDTILLDLGAAMAPDDVVVVMTLRPTVDTPVVAVADVDGNGGFPMTSFVGKYHTVQYLRLLGGERYITVRRDDSGAHSVNWMAAAMVFRGAGPTMLRHDTDTDPGTGRQWYRAHTCTTVMSGPVTTGRTTMLVPGIEVIFLSIIDPIGTFPINPLTGGTRPTNPGGTPAAGTITKYLTAGLSWAIDYRTWTEAQLAALIPASLTTETTYTYTGTPAGGAYYERSTLPIYPRSRLVPAAHLTEITGSAQRLLPGGIPAPLRWEVAEPTERKLSPDPVDIELPLEPWIPDGPYRQEDDLHG